MAKLAFCGLGNMGLPMARRLAEAGHDLTVWNRTTEKAAPLVERGAKLARSPADAGAEAEAAITMLADPQALDRVVFGPKGLAEALQPGATLIDMSTVGPEAVRVTGTWLRRGVEMLDAPVLGGPRQAEEGALKIFVGGPEEIFGKWSPVLEAMGTPLWLGPPGAGAAMKLVVNSTLVAIMTGLAEALALGDALGLEGGAMLDVLSASPIGATTRSKRANVENNSYPPNFKLSLARKDVELVLEEARRAGLKLPVAAAAKWWLETAGAAQLGGLDYSAVIGYARRKGEAFKRR